MLKSLLGLVAAACLASVAAYAPAGAVTSHRVTPRTARATLPAPTTTHHFIANIRRLRPVARLGFTVLDTGDSRDEIRSLPSGTQALVWLGQHCPTRADASFRRTIDRLGHDPRVFGYYLSDEPERAGCPHGPAALASRARYIRRVSHAQQKSFIVMSDSGSYHAYRPAVTRVSMVGLDPYPCSVAHPRCAFGKVREKVQAALRAGIPQGRIVPVYQAFGQERTASHYYNLPTAPELRTLLARWAAQVPSPPMDYTYGWHNQDSAAPTLIDATDLQAVLQQYFAG